jgi:HAD superfamily hydrolase (TIGR01509 family)
MHPESPPGTQPSGRPERNWSCRRRGSADHEQLARQVHVRKTELFVEMVYGGEIAPRPGVVRLLDELVTADVRLAIATTGRAAWVLPLLDGLFGLDRFTVIVCGDDVSKLKPDPEAYLLALKALRLNSDDAVAIEDARNGLLAARRAGLRCRIVTNDYTALQDFAGAELVLDSFERPEPSQRLVVST